MSAFDFLTEYDKELIERYIKNYGPTISYRYNTSDMKSLGLILKEWNNQKSRNLLKLFGDNSLIISRPYSYLAQAEALSQKINEALYDAASTAFHKWYDTMTHTAGNTIEVTDMQGNNFKDKENWFYSTWYHINECMTSFALASNAYLGEDCIIHFPKSGKQMKLFRGMKPMKVLHRIVQEFDGPEDIFDAYRTWHSMQLNQKRMDGELCLSIHPMDFITMSDNANGWKSCMRWTDPTSNDDDHGDFRSGTVQCMNSPYIIVAYLHNPEHKYYPFNDEYSWNSKQWRELFIIHDGVINEIKGYPFQDENLTNTCLMWLKELASKNLGWDYDNDEIDVGQAISTVNPIEQIMLTYDAGGFMYKDIGTIQKHRGRVNRKKLLIPDKYSTQKSFDATHNLISYFITIPYGGEATCMSCGAPLPYERSERVMCDYCDTVQICGCCGEPIYDNCVYWVEERDDPICEGCFEDECMYDAFNSDEYHFTNNMSEIYLLLGYDSNNKSVFYENTALTYEPQDEGSNFKTVFPKGYHEIEYDEGWYHSTRDYIIWDEMDDRYKTCVYDAFNIYPYEFEKFYKSTMIDDYDLVYDYHHNPLFPDENKEDKEQH